jgi:hypothetical protein
LPSPDFESALLKDRVRHREIGGDKTAFYRVFLSLGRTRRDRDRHPVAVKWRSNGEQARRNGTVPRAKPCDLQIFESALGRTRTYDLLIRSLNTYVRGCSLMSQNPHI